MDRDLINEIAKEFGISQESIVRDISSDSFNLARTDSLSLNISNGFKVGLRLELVYCYKDNYWVGGIEYTILKKGVAQSLKEALLNNSFKVAPPPNWIRKPDSIEFSINEDEIKIVLNKV